VSKSVVFILDDDLIIPELRRRGILQMMQPGDGRDTAIYCDESDLSIFTYSNVPDDSGYTWMIAPNKYMFDMALQDIKNNGKRLIQFQIFGR